MPHGRVKLWVPALAYGFVAPDDRSHDVFFTLSVVEGGQAPAEGQGVEYELAASTKIPQARTVRLLVPGGGPG
jgi:cold shock CspA family protein